MSDYERNKGKLTPITVDEEVAKAFVLSKDTELDDFYETFLDQFSDDPYYYSSDTVCKINDKWYLVEWEINGANEVPEFAEAIKNEDGCIDFHTYHYNGGAHWTEVVEHALEKSK